MTIRFLRNKVVEVEPQADGGLAVSWRLTDDLLNAEINIKVQPPDLEIVKAEARLARSCVAFQDDSPIMKGL